MRTHRLHALAWGAALVIGAAACSTGERSTSRPAASAGDPHSIELSQPVVGPVGELEVVVATVRDAEGRPVEGVRVEWILALGGVGSIVDIDEFGSSSNHQHYDATYAVTGTNDRDRVLDMGTADTADDIELGPGQTWIAITSPIEGQTHILAYAPQIRGWANQKAMATKNWRDVRILWPESGTKRVGESGEMVVQVVRASDGGALAGQEVTFAITGGPAAVLNPGGGQTVQTKTDAQGMARATLVPRTREQGTVTVQIDVMRPANEECCEPAVLLGSTEVACKFVAASIDIEKRAPARARVNTDFRYDLAVKAGTGAAARGVKVTDVLPAGIQYVSSRPAASVNGQTLSWDLGTMEPGSSRSLQVVVRATRTGTFENCAEVVAEEGSLKDRSCAQTLVTAPKLALVKTGPETAVACDEITFTFQVTNGGDAEATNVRITDDLPDGLSTPSGGKTLSIDVGTLAPGETKTVSAKVVADSTGTFKNTATATADGGLEAKDDHTIIVTKPVLKVIKDGPERRFVGRPVTYEITVTNTGNAPASNVVLTDGVPSGTVFLSASDGGTETDGTVRWSLGTLAPGASRKVSMTVTPEEDGVIVNTVQASAECAEPVTDSHQVRVEGIPAILLEVVDEDDPVEVGSTTVYAITVTNQGSADARDIVIKATIPAQMSFVSADGPTAETVTGKNVTFASLPRLAPGARASYRITVRANAAGDVRMQVSMVSAQSTVPVEETESTFLYQ